MVLCWRDAASTGAEKHGGRHGTDGLELCAFSHQIVVVSAWWDFRCGDFGRLTGWMYIGDELLLAGNALGVEAVRGQGGATFQTRNRLFPLDLLLVDNRHL